jgi:hypothetical protein
VSVQIKSGVGTDALTVGPTSKAAYAELRDAAGNPLAPTLGTQVGATQTGLLTSVLDEGGLAVPVRGGKVGSLGSATGQLLFLEDYEGTTLNTARWIGALTTFTVAQAATGLNLNSGASAAANGVTVLNSARRFERRMNQILDLEFRARVSAVTNSVVELGLGDTTSGVTVIVSNCALFRYDATSMTPVLSFGGTEITGSAVDMTAYGANYLDYGIVVEDFSVTFTVKRSDTGALVNRQVLRFPLSNAKAWAATRLPLMFRVYNKASVPASAPVAILGSVSLMRLDDASATPLAHVMSGLSLGGEAIPLTGQPNTNYANSAAPASATLSNAAAGYATLGGQWQFAAAAGAETDYCLFGYQVPVPFNYYVTGVHIGQGLVS